MQTYYMKTQKYIILNVFHAIEITERSAKNIGIVSLTNYANGFSKNKNLLKTLYVVSLFILFSVLTFLLQPTTRKA